MMLRGPKPAPKTRLVRSDDKLLSQLLGVMVVEMMVVEMMVVEMIVEMMADHHLADGEG